MSALAERFIDADIENVPESGVPISERYRRFLHTQHRASLVEGRNGDSHALTAFSFDKLDIPAIAKPGKIEPTTVPQPPASRSLQPIQEWEGYVSDVRRDSFVARLIDLTKGTDYESETAEFSFSEIREDHVSLVSEGAIFRWVIGYLRSVSGEKQRVSDVVFRRLPAWTKRDVETANRKAEKLIEEILWD